jgi:hypothetical protein
MHVRIVRLIRLLTLMVMLASVVPAWPMPQTDQSSSSGETKTKRSKAKKASADQNTSEKAAAKIDLNTATKEELGGLPPVLVKRTLKKSLMAMPYSRLRDLPSRRRPLEWKDEAWKIHVRS